MRSNFHILVSLFFSYLGWRPWASWQSCNKDCGGGSQTRRRVCVRDVPNACEGDARQKRQCNTFDCADMKNMKQILHLNDFPPGVRRAPGRWTAYKITHHARTLRVPTSTIYGKTFPDQFAVLLTVKPKVTLRKNRGDPYALLFTDAGGNIQFGIKLTKTPSVVYSQLDGTLKELNFTDYVLDRSWHYLAFSVNKHTVTLIADCNYVFTLNIERSDRATIDATGTTSIGGGYQSVNNVYFEGDIAQMVLMNDSTTAELQCHPQERRFPDLLDIASTAPPSSSMNGMDASIDIGLVYDNLFDPFLFMETETTTTAPMDTTFPSFSQLDITDDGLSEESASPTIPSTTTWITKKIMTPATQRPKTSTPALTKLTVKWDNGAFGTEEESNSDFIGIVNPEESVEFSVSGIDYNHATGEPVFADSGQGVSGRSDAAKQRTDDSKYWTLTPTTPTSRREASAYSQIKVFPTTITEPPTRKSTTVPSTTKATTTMTTTSATTTPSTTTTMTTTTTTTSVPTTRTIATTTPLSTTSTVSVKSTSEMNDILGDVDLDNNSERPLNDGLIPAPPGDILSPVAPATVQRPSIYQYGRPIDEMANWSTWSTCSRTCGTGTRYRYTICSGDSNLPDCRNGRGIAAQHKSCQLNNNCKGILRWSDWGSCTRTCGSGFETRVAICRDLDSHENCTSVGQLMIERRRCEGLSECPNYYCIGGCLNGGTCMPGGVCQCASGYDGQMCETELCQHSCKNGGRCVGRNKCQCPYGHLPPYCEPLCNPPCQNNGRCIHPGRCICPNGYTGSSCSKPICRRGCANGGECIAPDQCHCPTGYSGPDCRQPECSPPCENKGVCVRAGFCRCPTGYRGIQCQIPYCRRSCLNGGKCSGADTCTCPRGYTGSLCQQSKCPGGCPGYSRCIGHNSCSSYGRHVVSSSSSTRRQWCPLQSYIETYTLTYIKPAIQKYRVKCGEYGLRTCESTRIIYQIGYRQSRRTAYKCAPYG